MGGLFRMIGKMLNGIDVPLGAVSYATKVSADRVLGSIGAANTTAHVLGSLVCFLTSMPATLLSIAYHGLFVGRGTSFTYRVNSDMLSPSRNLIFNSALMAGLHYTGYSSLLFGALAANPMALAALVGLTFLTHQLASGLVLSGQKFSSAPGLYYYK
jgi:hypothetical protein